VSEALTTRRLLDELASAPVESIPLGDLLDRFSERAFGLFLLVAVLPAFLPLPGVAGAVSGPLVMLAGLQMALLAKHPWLPDWLQRRPVATRSIRTFQRRLAWPLAAIERVSQPRWPELFDRRLPHAFNGVLLVVLGLLLALPIPLTNYPFGLVLVVFAVAMIERDGRTLCAAWVLALLQMVLIELFVEEAAQWLRGVI